MSTLSHQCDSLVQLRECYRESTSVYKCWRKDVQLTFGFIGDLPVEHVYGVKPTILPQFDVDPGELE